MANILALGIEVIFPSSHLRLDKEGRRLQRYNTVWKMKARRYTHGALVSGAPKHEAEETSGLLIKSGLVFRSQSLSESWF